MCYAPDAAPPPDDRSDAAVSAAPLTLTSADGTSFAAFLARPREQSEERPDSQSGDHAPSTSGVGVVVLPDLRGLHGFYQRLAERLAGRGYTAMAIDYYGRTAGTSNRDDGFPFMEHAMKLNRDALQDDLATAIGYLRGDDGGGCRAVLALGFCFGGRQAFFASAPRFGLAGVIGFYGAPGLAGPYGPGPAQHAAELAAPILALFGGADEGIPASAVAEFDQALSAVGVEHEIVSYPGAPHGFFDVKQEQHAEASADAWQRVLGFLQTRSLAGNQERNR